MEYAFPPQTDFAPARSPSILESVWGPVTDATYSLGLLGYPNAAFVRLAVGTLVAGIVLQIWKPSLFFIDVNDKTGVPKQWSLTASEAFSTKYPTALTAVPWWLAAIAAGFAFAVFV